MSSLSSRARANRWPIFAYALLPLAAAASVAQADPLPTGGTVASGSAAIGVSNGAMTIDQASQTAVIDWAGFSIGQGASVDFQNGSGATLNRVSGTSVSSIDGLLSATGSVYLLNPNGVVIGREGVVDVGGSFVASTQNLTDQAFQAGGALTFSGSSGAAVVNFGRIGSLGGDVALIAARVANHGEIRAPQGAVGLLAGYTVTLRDAALDDGKFVVQAGGADVSATNVGAIMAAQAELRAEGGNVYALAGNDGGIIRATGVAQSDGRIFLVASNGRLTVSGRLEARAAGGGGGFIETSGETLELTGMSLDAGAGGQWLLDPTTLHVDQALADTISGTLNAGTDVTHETNSGSGGDGDIFIDPNVTVSWTTTATLTLDAYRNLTFEQGSLIDVAGAGQLHLDYGSGGPGELRFNGGRVAFTGSGGGLQINGDTYVIYDDLAALAAAIASDASGFYALGDNIDVSGTPFTSSPIPTVFTGVLNGLGNAIDGLTINSTTDGSIDPSCGCTTTDTTARLGLFELIDTGGRVESLGLTNASLSGGKYTSVGALAGESRGTVFGAWSTGTATSDIGSNVGGLIGWLNLGRVDSSHADVTVSGDGDDDNFVPAYIGGLVGTSDGAISNSYANGDVSGENYAVGLGGLVGAGDGTISDSYATGDITTHSNGPLAGGLVGYQVNSAGVYGAPAELTGAITNSYATGKVTAPLATTETAAGGLVGFSVGITITGSYATGEVFGGGVTGGLVGAFDPFGGTTILGSWATGDVTGTEWVGGLVGGAYRLGSSFAGAAFIVRDSYASGDVVGTDRVGGLIGNWDSGGGSLPPMAITDAYALGSVTGTSNVGGLIGYYNGGSLDRAYAIGAVTGTTATGGLIGLRTGAGVLTNTYWDTTTTGMAAGVGTGSATGTSAVQSADPLAPNYAYDPASYAGFDFTGAGHWFAISGGTRPLLRSEYSTTITNAHQLQLMAMDLTADYVLGFDISADDTALGSQMWTAAGFVPLGPAFSGELDGAGHAIDGLFIDRASEGNVGLFRIIAPGGSVHDLSLTGVDVTGGANTGGLVGHNRGLVERVSVAGLIEGGERSGGLAGVNGLGGTIDESDADVDMTGSNYLGGLAGLNLGAIHASSAAGTVDGDAVLGGLVGENQGTVDEGSSATGDVTGTEQVGGLAGRSMAAGVIADSSASGKVSGTNYVGGLVGLNFGAIHTGSADGDVSGSALVGGLVGENRGGIDQISIASGTVDGVTQVGGLVGRNTASGTIDASRAEGAVAATGTVGGGLVGYNAGDVTRSYATGTVSADTFAGGLVGDNAGTLSNVYATGDVTAVIQRAGGLVGRNTSTGVIEFAYAANTVTGLRVGGVASVNDGTLTSTYWDTTVSGLMRGVRTGDATGATGLTTTQLQAGLPAGFDPGTWGITAGSTYPYLLVFP